MSTGVEHYREAERLLDLAERTDCDPMSIIASAQVHATLAVAAATAEPIVQAYNGREDTRVPQAWSVAIS